MQTHLSYILKLKLCFRHSPTSTPERGNLSQRLANLLHKFIGDSNNLLSWNPMIRHLAHQVFFALSTHHILLLLGPQLQRFQTLHAATVSALLADLWRTSSIALSHSNGPSSSTPRRPTFPPTRQGLGTNVPDWSPWPRLQWSQPYPQGLIVSTPNHSPVSSTLNQSPGPLL